MGVVGSGIWDRVAQMEVDKERIWKDMGVSRSEASHPP